MSVPPIRKYKIAYEVGFDSPGSQKQFQPFLVDLVTLEKLFFQGIPNELDYQPESGWVAIASPGRNTPFYHYSGAEDTLVLNLSFFSDFISRDDVLKKCKWLEALSKNDGYDAKPHAVSLYWGQMFRDAKWIVYSAPAKFMNFNRQMGMLPQCAVVELTLKRISETNRSRSNMLKLDT
jgi:hypothetical protein